MLPTRDALGIPADNSALPITVVIPALNEEDRIVDCVRRAADWADEVIVVDGGSADNTVQLAENAGAAVHILADCSIGAQRNAGAGLARNNWIFALDADERASEELIVELRAALLAGGADSYMVRMQNFYLCRERKRGRWGRDWHARIYRKGMQFTESRVHERLDTKGGQDVLKGPVIHTPYRDLAHHVAKIRSYSRWGALDLHERGRKPRFSDLVFRPVFRFLRDYLVYGNVLDGQYGFIASALTGYGVFLKYAFLYELANSDVSQGRPDSPGSAPSR